VSMSYCKWESLVNKISLNLLTFSWGSSSIPFDCIRLLYSAISYWTYSKVLMKWMIVQITVLSQKSRSFHILWSLMNSNKNTFFWTPPDVALLKKNVDDNSMHYNASEVSVAPTISSNAIFNKSLTETNDC
jgi:hypothetical protein